MSTKNAYETIHAFCEPQHIDPVYEKILLHTYYKEYDEIIKSRDSSKGAILEDESNAYKDTLLSNTNLAKNLSIAKAEIENIVVERTKRIEKRQKFRDFGANVGIGILSNILFTIMALPVSVCNIKIPYPDRRSEIGLPYESVPCS
jgi:hypothetical protein